MEVWNGVLQQLVRFWSFQDGSTRSAAAGIILLGIGCGTLGCFIVLRRMSLVGDSLGHAVLPGVCLGFLVNSTKDPFWIFLGAVASALLGSWLVGLIQRRSRLKPDVALGLVLSGFFGLGVVMLTRLQHFPLASQGGLKDFLFGQAAAVSDGDLALSAGVAAIIVLALFAFFKELALTSFDDEFARACGMPATMLHYLLMTLTALAVVISIQAVGVVLLSALLITPAATALLLTDRLKSMIAISAAMAVGGGLIGLCLSFLGRGLPTGPWIVVVLTVLFSTAYLVAPRRGLLTRAFRRARHARRTRHENLLKVLYQASCALEATGQRVSAAAALSSQTLLPLSSVAEFSGQSTWRMAWRLAPLRRAGWIERLGNDLRLTESGLLRARELERNYRLWELFLTHEVNLPLDHTQRDAEDIEHLLGPELVHELERRFELPALDAAASDKPVK
jgi:manganese/zinc/iron transport system permease protein